jgi:NitT/TauT family transport system substrate-binding protein
MKRFFLILSALTTLFFAGCSKNSPEAAGAAKGKLRIATGLSTIYAPLYVMEAKKLLETKYLPGWKIEWSTMGNSTAMAEALAADRLDIMFSGPPQALIMWDKGVESKILCGIGTSLNVLMVNNPNIKTLGDFTPADKIAVPSIGSNQSILFGMACEKYFGNAHALDNNLLPVNHADASAMVISGQNITAHFAPDVYALLEQKAGLSDILTTKQILGSDHSNVAQVSKKLHDENPLALAGFYAALCEAITLVNDRDPEAIQITADKLKITAEEALESLDFEGHHTTTLYGIEAIADFMYREGYISRKPALEDILWEPALAAIGKRSGEPGILEQAQKRGE